MHFIFLWRNSDGLDIFSEGIMRHAALFLQKAWYNYFFWQQWSATSFLHNRTVYFFLRAWCFSEEIMRHADLFLQHAWYYCYFFWKKQSASLFLQTKMFVLFWRNQEVCKLLTSVSLASLFIQKRISIFFWRNNGALFFCWRNIEARHCFLMK